MDEQTYTKLKREVEEAKSASDKAAGALTQLTKQLKEEHGCDTMIEGKKKLAKLEEELEEAEAEFQTALTKYRKKWKSEDED
jgi:predicted  nucleic acid-binding Zn-ribbon protein